VLVHTLASKLSVNVYAKPPALVCEFILGPLLVHTRPPHGWARRALRKRRFGAIEGVPVSLVWHSRSVLPV
jgi:hypothetical protein